MFLLITPFVKELESHFVSTEDFAASYSFIIEGIKKPLYVAIENGELEIHYGQEEKIDVVAKLSRDVLQSIIDGRMTFQRAFMTGEMTAKGNFKTTSSYHLYILVAEFAESLIQDLLHSYSIYLDLPSAIICSIVGYDQFYSLHIHTRDVSDTSVSFSILSMYLNYAPILNQARSSLTL